MADLDFKQIGLAAKDIIFGVGSAAAGASGGPAAAEGVAKAGTGLDRILGMAGVMETRADKFDRADFGARPQPTAQTANVLAQTAPPSAPATRPPTQTASPPAQTGPSLPSASRPPHEAGPLVGDERITADHLRNCGWSRTQVAEILRGPEYTSLAALFGRETRGFRARGVDGTRVAQVDAAAVPTRAARVVPTADGQSVPTVRGTRV